MTPTTPNGRHSIREENPSDGATSRPTSLVRSARGAMASRYLRVISEPSTSWGRRHDAVPASVRGDGMPGDPPRGPLASGRPGHPVAVHELLEPRLPHLPV